MLEAGKLTPERLRAEINELHSIIAREERPAVKELLEECRVGKLYHLERMKREAQLESGGHNE